jgi:hypothetical protein
MDSDFYYEFVLFPFYIYFTQSLLDVYVYILNAKVKYNLILEKKINNDENNHKLEILILKLT